MTTENSQTPGESGNEERLDVLSEYATDWMFKWLTGQEGRAREYVREAADWEWGSESAGASDAPDRATVSESMRYETARLLSLTFGDDAPRERYDVGTWPGYCAFGLSAWIDWEQLADWLLHRYVPGYAPKKAETI
jgi:hypothetical protein